MEADRSLALTVRGWPFGEARVTIDLAEDVCALLLASGPGAGGQDRSCVARGRGLPIDGDEARRLRDALFRTLDVLAVATVKLAARDGRPYDEVVAEWWALLGDSPTGSSPR